MPTTDTPQNAQFLSNDVDDFVAAGFGPEQATIRVISSEYASFDYKGTLANDPVVAVKWNCEPLDGSNSGKTFEIEWPTGPKISEVSIVNNGGHLVPGPGFSKSALSNNSNWALAFKALKDVGFNTSLLNGDAGVGFFVGGEFTIKRIPQPKREGIEEKNTKGYDKSYYTFLRLDAMPGEKGKRGARPAAGRETVTVGAKDVGKLTVVPNGAGSSDKVALVASALAAANNSIAIPALQKAVFQLAKSGGASAKEAMTMAQEATVEDFLIETAMEKGWTLNNGILGVS